MIDLDTCLPVIPTRSGWREIEEGRNGSVESWKSSPFEVATQVINEFSEQRDDVCQYWKISMDGIGSPYEI